MRGCVKENVNHLAISVTMCALLKDVYIVVVKIVKYTKMPSNSNQLVTFLLGAVKYLEDNDEDPIHDISFTLACKLCLDQLRRLILIVCMLIRFSEEEERNHLFCVALLNQLR